MTKPKETWREIWEEHRPSDLSSGHPLLRLIKKILRKPGDLFLAARLDQQKKYNLHLLDRIQDLEDGLNNLRPSYTTMEKDIKILHQDLVAVQDHFQRAFQELQGDTLHLRDDVFPTMKEQTEAVLDGVDAKAEWALARTRRFMATIQKREIEEIPSGSADHLSYAAFEDSFRGSFDSIRDDLTWYLGKIGDNYPVWDLGCGRGEFLSLLKAEAIPCKGVESNRSLCKALAADDLPVVCGDFFDVLKEVGDASLGCVTLFHVLEHIPLSGITRLLRLIHDKLKPGGLLMAEIPDTSNLNGLFNFFKDPGHITPLHSETIQYYLNEAGFTGIALTPRHPVSEENLLQVSDNAPKALTEAVERFNAVLYGNQDLAVMGRRAQ